MQFDTKLQNSCTALAFKYQQMHVYVFKIYSASKVLLGFWCEAFSEQAQTLVWESIFSTNFNRL